MILNKLKNLFSKKQVYKIYRGNDINNDESYFYISTSKTKEEISNSIIDFVYFVENNTMVNKKYPVSNDMISYYLCSFANCKIVNPSFLSNLKNYDKTKKDIDKKYHIDIWEIRDQEISDNYPKNLIDFEVCSIQYRYHLY